MKPGASGIKARSSRFAALLLVSAFALAGWKIAHRLPASSFATGFAAEKMHPPSAAPQPQQFSSDGRFRFDARFVSTAPGEAVHAPSVVELRDGRLRAVWFSGSREGAGDVVIKTSVLNQTSLRWSDESTLFDRQRIQQGLWRYVKKLGNPVIARAPDGSLLLWMVTVSVGGWAGSSITWARSTDEGGSWSDPRRLVTSPFLNISTLVKAAPFFYQNGQTGLPVYHESATKFAEVLRIDAQGNVIDKTRIPGSRNSLQPVVLTANPTQAQVYMRSANGKAVMESATNDAGITWSSARATSWPNPDSALAGVVTESGEQWLALNPSPEGRGILALLRAPAASSFDGVRPWIVESYAIPLSRPSPRHYERLLGDELKAGGANQHHVDAYVASAKRQLCGPSTCSEEFSYPYLLQSRDGYLHLVYTWHRTRIKHVRLDPMEVFPPGSGSPAARHAAPAAR